MQNVFGYISFYKQKQNRECLDVKERNNKTDKELVTNAIVDAIEWPWQQV